MIKLVIFRTNYFTKRKPFLVYKQCVTKNTCLRFPGAQHSGVRFPMYTARDSRCDVKNLRWLCLELSRNPHLQLCASGEPLPGSTAAGFPTSQTPRGRCHWGETHPVRGRHTPPPAPPQLDRCAGDCGLSDSRYRAALTSCPSHFTESRPQEQGNSEGSKTSKCYQPMFALHIGSRA